MNVERKNSMRPHASVEHTANANGNADADVCIAARLSVRASCKLGDAHRRRVRALRLRLHLHSAEPNSETMERKTTGAERKIALPGWRRLPYDVVDAGDKARGEPPEHSPGTRRRRAHGRKLDHEECTLPG